MKKIILIIITFTCLMLKVDAASNPYQKTSPYGVNCTWYAWQQAYDKAGIALPGWGNANTWLNYAKKAGYETGTTPRAKSIVVWKWDNYGHVGYVEKVSNGKIYVWDSEGPCTDTEDPDYKSCLANSPSEQGDRECYQKYGKSIACEYNASYWQYPGDLIGYIYLDKAPTKINNQTEPSKNTPTKKSNNTNLTSLTIDNIDFEFKNDTLKYKFDVNNEITKVKIEAKPENSKTKVENTGEHDLNIGQNIIKITVIAEDNTKKTYTLEITRKDNNAYLSNLILSYGKIDFLKDKFNYDLEVEDNIENIEVTGTTESTLATIEGLGTYNLTEDITSVSIKVIAEDKTTNIYTINIKKKSKEELKKQENAQVENNKTYVVYIIIGLVTLISLIVIVLIIKKAKFSKTKN